jgi:hypothetical protein
MRSLNYPFKAAAGPVARPVGGTELPDHVPPRPTRPQNLSYPFKHSGI